MNNPDRPACGQSVTGFNLKTLFLLCSTNVCICVCTQKSTRILRLLLNLLHKQCSNCFSTKFDVQEIVDEMQFLGDIIVVAL